ncbi:Por secretion system C-terminal sorting domain-containing protein [Flavobacteriaceae bacterium MAR_2010_188]|nr:Por secretion system C-terminal sorting domain-containing protein [Flavobacteriaceae bacterium MAR_2010_188]
MNLQSPFKLNTKRIRYTFILLLSCANSFAQQLTVRANLDEQVKESSGLIYLNSELFTHNDSDGEPALYQLDLDSNSVSRKIEIQNAKNVDWEDLAHDETYVYIADLGNNNGNRQDLKIYKVLIADIMDMSKEKISTEVINFSYANQTDFNPSPYDTNFDAETLICYRGSLYIFTKNWSDFKTNIYKLSTDPGDKVIEKIDQLNVNGLISGGVYNSITDEIVLTGYSEENAFIVKLSNIENENFSESTIERTDLLIPSGISYQVEGITYTSAYDYILSSESGIFGNGALMDLNLDNTLKLTSLQIRYKDSIYPNPAKDYVNLSFTDFDEAEIFNAEGKKVKTSKNKKIFVGDLQSGAYIINTKGGKDQAKSFKFIKD